MLTIKEQITDALREEGYDFITACEIWEEKLAELRAQGPGTYTFHSRDHSFTVQIHAPKERQDVH